MRGVPRVPRLPTPGVITRHGPTRLPLAPLLAFVSSRSDLARRVGRSRRTVLRWSHAGLTLDRVEDVASMLERHPSEIWDGYEEAVAADLAWREGSAARHREARRRRLATGSGQLAGRGSPAGCPGKADELVLGYREDGTAEILEKVEVVR